MDKLNMAKLTMVKSIMVNFHFNWFFKIVEPKLISI
jgi:hypothetical protein